jgi:hypothetical protein
MKKRGDGTTPPADPRFSIWSDPRASFSPSCYLRIEDRTIFCPRVFCSRETSLLNVNQESELSGQREPRVFLRDDLLLKKSLFFFAMTRADWDSLSLLAREHGRSKGGVSRNCPILQSLEATRTVSDRMHVRGKET